MQVSSEALLQIADLDRQILIHQKSLDTLPAKRAKIRATLDQVEAERAKIAKSQETLQTQVKLRERLIELEQGKIKSANERMMGVNNQKEYMAVQREIDASSRTIKKVEDQILNLEEQMEPLKAQLDEVEKSRQEAAAQFEADDQVYKTEESEKSQIISSAKEQIAQLKPQVAAEWLAEYDKLMERNLIPAAVGIDDAFCGGCAASIRAQIFNDIIKEGAGQCPNCKRLLFYRPPAEDAEGEDGGAKAG